MQKYKLTCEDGFTRTIEAPSKEVAVKIFLAHPEVLDHVKKEHPDELTKTPEEMTAMVAGMVEPEAM